ncbi:MAG: hypothetical protein U0Z26_12760 [Anaerolineales bacterium]
MKSRSRLSLTTVMITLVLIFSAMITIPVYADDSTPPTDAISPVLASSDSIPSTDTSTPAVEPTTTDIPEDTQEIITSPMTSVIPLASTEAEKNFFNGDPIWCPAGVAPKDGLSGCSPSMSGFTVDTIHSAPGGLLGWLNNPANGAAISKAGTIWVAYDYSSAGESTGAFVLSPATTQGTMENFALTVQGGWNGTLGSIALNGSHPTSTLNNALSINGWAGAVTINNLTIQNVNNSVAAWDSALEVDTTGNILLNNVTVQNNSNSYDNTVDTAYDRDGIYLRNAVLGGSAKTVTLNNVTVSNNDGYGLFVISNGVITINNLIATGNGTGGNGYDNNLNTCTGNCYADGIVNQCYGGCNEDGVYLDNTFSTTNAGIVMKGLSQIFNNSGNGLTIFTKGTVTAANLNAMGNDFFGARIDNCNYTTVDFNAITCQTTSGAGVTLTGFNTFKNNGADGLRVFSGGAITVSNLTALDNGTNPNRPHTGLIYEASGKGVFLVNDGATVGKAITLSGTNLFNNNSLAGLFIVTKGDATMNNVTATYNAAANGATYCNNSFELDGLCAGLFLNSHNFTLTGYGIFSHNYNGGMTVYTQATIKAANVYAEKNGGAGAYLQNFSSSITLTGSNFFVGNTSSGLFINSIGAISLSNINALNNSGKGADLQNSTLGAGVTITGSNAFVGNTGIGLDVVSKGAITLNNINASNNLDEGARLYNWDHLTVSAAPSITLNGYNTFNGNTYLGLEVITHGVITTYNLTANNNGMTGVSLQNCIAAIGFPCAGASSNVYVYGVNTFNFNGGGLFVDDQGLQILSSGNIVANNLTANSNNGTGVVLRNCLVTVGKPVTVNGYINVANNALSGLQIDGGGIVTVNNINASNNNPTNQPNESGVAIVNNYVAGATADVILLGYGVFNNNGGNYGLSIYSSGNITTNNLTANNNTGTGVALITQDLANSVIAKNVTMLGVNNFNNNQGAFGLYVRSDGAITLNNINANNNANFGAYLDNFTYSYAGTAFNMTLNGINNFNYNGKDGLGFAATGAVNMSRVTANFNDGLANSYTGQGIHGTTTGGTMTLTCVVTIGNGESSGYYLWIGNGKTLTVNGVVSYGNGLADYVNPLATNIIKNNCPLP